MGLSGIIDSILDSTESVADTTAEAADSKFRAITRVAIALIAVIAFLIVYALDATMAVGILVLLIVAAYLLDYRPGSSDSSGPRQ
ncbi:hypothetical protein [Natrinema thermotolerans]